MEMKGKKDYREVTVECLIDDIVEGFDLKERRIEVKLHEPFTVRHLIEVLEKQYPKLKGKIKDNETYLPYVMIVVNGYELLPVSEDDRRLEDGNTVSLMYVSVGG